MTINVEDSFELLTQEEWDRYFSVALFDEMTIEEAYMGGSSDFFQNFGRPRLQGLIMEHNNKVGNLQITYALCMHYFDRGIPDDPWYISPGKEGQSIQYFPEFKKEHYMRLFWFGYYADAFYLRISAVWDSLIEIINHYYGLNYASDLRLRSNVMKWLKDNQLAIFNVFQCILQEPVYKEAQKYRTMAAHGNSPSMVQNTMKQQKDVIVEVPDYDENGNIRIDGNGKVINKQVREQKVVSATVGDYVMSATLKSNMENCAVFTGQKIKQIINMMVS